MTAEELRLLLVDDDRTFYLLVRDMLAESEHVRARLDWEPSVARGRAALTADAHDAYLIDYRLGDGTGLELLRAAAELDLRGPVILLTAYSAREVDLHAMGLGAADYLDKSDLSAPLLERSIRYAIERRRMALTLRDREARFRALTERSLDITAVLESDGTIRYGSPALTRVLGYPPDELVGVSAFEHIHPDDVEAARSRFAQIVVQQTSPGVIEFRFRHRDGTWRLLEAVGTNWMDDPAIGGIIINARDITERRDLELQLRQAQKMEAIGQLAGGVAHDFNNLLGVINGYAELLIEAAPLDDLSLTWLEEIRRAGERAASLTGQLLAFSRRQVVAPRILDLDEVIANLEPMLRRLIGEHIVLRHLPNPISGKVRADPTQIEQILLNLVINARDAMPDGGTVTVQTRNVELDADYARAHHTVEPGTYVLLSVTDTGVGMTPEVQARIFEPFFTTKEVGKGTGLGLATVYGIVKQCEGYVWVYSEPDAGTVFKLYFPRVADGTDSADGGGASAGGQAGSETILLVEDEATLRQLTRSVLERAGYHVVEASGGAEALAVAGAQPGPIHLLMTDVVMPGMNGRELGERLREIRPDLRILYTSGYTDDTVLRLGVLSGGASFIQKPFTPRNLLNVVRESLDKAGG